VKSGPTGFCAPDYGALVISLDLELHWGVRDLMTAQGSQQQVFLGARQAIPEILKLFEAFGVSATWAVVGFLFASSKQELQSFSPPVRPEYQDANLSPYREIIGDSESDDPIHYGPSLIRAIRATPGQEIGTHTFSHYYCLEPGQTHVSFGADLDSAVALARRYGITLRSLVFPRNQFNPEYADVVANCGILCCRGNQAGWMYRAVERRRELKVARRLAALVDTYVNLTGKQNTEWNKLLPQRGVCTVPASHCLRPFSPRRAFLDRLRLRRIVQCMRAAAIKQRVFHLWGHPEDFGLYTEAGIGFLRQVLEVFARCRQQYGMRSLSMAEAATVAGSFGARS